MSRVNMSQTIKTEDPSWCQPCQRHFVNVEALRQHNTDARSHGVREAAPGPGPIASKGRTLKCKICSKQFKSKSALSAHLQSPTQKHKDLSSASQPNKIAHVPDVPEQVPGGWTSIPLGERDMVLDALRSQCHPVDSLFESRYWTRVPTQLDIDMLTKCIDCRVVKGKVDNGSITACQFHPAKKPFQRGVMRGKGGPHKERCFNCLQAGKGKGCITLSAHTFSKPDALLLQMRPSPSHHAAARKAVVLDCEMVGVLGTNNHVVSEVVRLSAVDFLTGEILIDTHVEPQRPIIQWRSDVSGVTPSILAAMQRQGRTVRGWNAARDLLWQFVDKDTILIGHSLHHDLDVLGMVHTTIVDSAILTKNAVGQCSRSWALRTLTQQFLNREIQTGAAGHDCTEDTYAAREVVLFCLRQPHQLQAWATSERGILAQRKKNETTTEEMTLLVEHLAKQLV
ncbi:ribonuclease H-like domain-containing protein [Aspergillus californicus]